MWPFKWKLLIEHYFPLKLFNIYAVQGGSESLAEILKCDHSNKSYWAVLSCGAVYYAVQGSSNFWICGWNPKVWPFKQKLLSAVLSCGAVYYAVQGSSNFWICWWNPKVWPLKWKLLSSSFLWCCLYCCTQSSHSFWKVEVLGPPVPWNWGSFLFFEGPLSTIGVSSFFLEFRCLFSKWLPYVICSHN